MALINFNAANVETQDNFDPIPNNWYNATITDSEMKPTQAGTGHYLECTLKVVDGDFAGRLLWLRLNLDNPNEVATEIAYKQLASICKALGVVQVNDSTELHGKPFQVKVVVRPPKGDYDASNDIKGFKAVDGGAPASSGQSSSGQAASGGQPAWAKKDKEEPKKEKEPEAKQEEAADTTVEKTPEAKEEVKQEEAGASSKPPWMK